MKPVETFLCGLRRVTEDCFAVFAPFYAERQKHYIYPVFYQSVTQMIGAGGFYYKVFDRGGYHTLAVFKRSSIMGNYSVMLHIAPICLEGARQEELNIIQEARRHGIAIKVCREDIDRYKIPVRLCDPIKGNLEYVYNATHISALEGGEFHTFRRCFRKVQRADGYRHTYGANADITALVEAWDRHNKDKGLAGVQTPHWRKIQALRSPKVHIHSIYTRDRLETFSVVEEVSPKHWVLVMGVRNYDSTLNDVNKAMHILDCQIASQGQTQTVYANLGAAIGIAGLDAEKEHLHPCCHQQIYRIAPSGKLDIQAVKQIFNTL